MTRVFGVSGAAGLALLVAAIDADRIGPGRRVLVIANEADVPEVTPGLSSVGGVDRLTARFDEVVSWNELIAPLHPAAWRPPQREIPVLARLLRARLSLDGPPQELVVESPVEGLGRTLTALLPDAPITVLGPGAAVYGPTLVEPGTEVIERIVRVLHLDLLPGVHPQWLDQVRTPTEAVPLAEVATAAGALQVPAGAVLLGERWAERGVLTAAAELEVQLDAVAALVAGGHTAITFAPHPAAAPADHGELVAAGRDAGATVTVGPAGVPHEVWLGADPLVGVAAPALYLAPRGASVATRRLLDGLHQYDHADRVALVAAHAALPRLADDGQVAAAEPADLTLLLQAVAYCLRPAIAPHLRDRAADWVAQHGPRPYLSRRTLERLGLETQARPAAVTEPTGAPRGGGVRGLLRRRRGDS